MNDYKLTDEESRRAIETISICHEEELARKDAECQARVDRIFEEIESGDKFLERDLKLLLLDAEYFKITVRMLQSLKKKGAQEDEPR